MFDGIVTRMNTDQRRFEPPMALYHRLWGESLLFYDLPDILLT
jgi:hypothetical protein